VGPCPKHERCIALSLLRDVDAPLLHIAKRELSLGGFYGPGPAKQQQPCAVSTSHACRVYSMGKPRAAATGLSRGEFGERAILGGCFRRTLAQNALSECRFLTKRSCPQGSEVGWPGKRYLFGLVMRPYAVSPTTPYPGVSERDVDAPLLHIA